MSQLFFENKRKTAICVMHYDALHHWSKFQTSLSTFQWVSAGMKTFEISKLENYKSYINETWPRCVSPGPL